MDKTGERDNNFPSRYACEGAPPSLKVTTRLANVLCSVCNQTQRGAGRKVPKHLHRESWMHAKGPFKPTEACNLQSAGELAHRTNMVRGFYGFLDTRFAPQ